MKYTLKDFDYHLPLELIAQRPSKPRDHSRLLLLNTKKTKIEHRNFYDIVDYLTAGDVLVINNSKVFPARLLGEKADTGGKVEIFLHKKIEKNLWQCLVGGKVKIDNRVNFGLDLQAKIISDNRDGTWQVEFNCADSKFMKLVDKLGQVPLPPYIKRKQLDKSDRHDYQTIFADPQKVGSVAAPTAGLHFTSSLIAKMKKKGVQIIEATLHVGLGTFSPVKTERIQEHKMHSEWVEIDAHFIDTINQAKKRGRRVIAVGTTSCRILESIDLTKKGQQSFWTNIFIFPGYKFKIVDALITNFHLPKSSLLMLVSALAGKEKIDQAYQTAIREKYRFFSYGDAMFIY